MNTNTTSLQNHKKGKRKRVTRGKHTTGCSGREKGMKWNGNLNRRPNTRGITGRTRILNSIIWWELWNVILPPSLPPNAKPWRPHNFPMPPFPGNILPRSFQQPLIIFSPFPFLNQIWTWTNLKKQQLHKQRWNERTKEEFGRALNKSRSKTEMKSSSTNKLAKTSETQQQQKPEWPDLTPRRSSDDEHHSSATDDQLWRWLQRMVFWRWCCCHPGSIIPAPWKP